MRARDACAAGVRGMRAPDASLVPRRARRDLPGRCPWLHVWRPRRPMWADYVVYSMPMAAYAAIGIDSDALTSRTPVRPTSVCGDGHYVRHPIAARARTGSVRSDSLCGDGHRYQHLDRRASTEGPVGERLLCGHGHHLRHSIAARALTLRLRPLHLPSSARHVGSPRRGFDCADRPPRWRMRRG